MFRESYILFFTISTSNAGKKKPVSPSNYRKLPECKVFGQDMLQTTISLPRVGFHQTVPEKLQLSSDNSRSFRWMHKSPLLVQQSTIQSHHITREKSSFVVHVVWKFQKKISHTFREFFGFSICNTKTNITERNQTQKNKLSSQTISEL